MVILTQEELKDKSILSFNCVRGLLVKHVVKGKS